MVPSTFSFPTPPLPTHGSTERLAAGREDSSSSHGTPTAFMLPLCDEPPGGGNVRPPPQHRSSAPVASRDGTGAEELTVGADEAEGSGGPTAIPPVEQPGDRTDVLVPSAFAWPSLPPPVAAISWERSSWTSTEGEAGPTSPPLDGSVPLVTEFPASGGLGQTPPTTPYPTAEASFRGGAIPAVTQGVSLMRSATAIPSPIGAEDPLLAPAGEPFPRPATTNGDVGAGAGVRSLSDSRAPTRGQFPQIAVSPAPEIKASLAPTEVSVLAAGAATQPFQGLSDTSVPAPRQPAHREGLESLASATDLAARSSARSPAERGPSKAGRRSTMSAETAAVFRTSAGGALDARSDPEDVRKINSLPVDLKSVAKTCSSVGIEAADTGAVMRDEHRTTAWIEMAGGAIAPATGSPVTNGDVRPAAAAVRWTSVDRVLDAADVLWATDRTGVDLKVQFEGEGIWVRVDYREGEVTATFRADSADLRDRLATAWHQHVSSSGELRPYRFADPLFVGGSLQAEDALGAHVASDSRSGDRHGGGHRSDESLGQGRTAVAAVGGGVATTSPISPNLPPDRGSRHRLRVFA